MNDFVVIKLVNGEMLMAALASETDDYVLIENPVGIKVIQVNTPHGIIEKTATSPFCSLSDDHEFNIDKRQILYKCNLHSSLIPIYLSLVNSFSDELNSFSDQVESILDRLNSIDDTETDTIESSTEEKQDNVFYIFPDETKLH